MKGGGENETRVLDMHAEEQAVSYPCTSLSPEKWQHVSLHSIAHLPSTHVINFAHISVKVLLDSNTVTNEPPPQGGPGGADFVLQ